MQNVSNFTVRELMLAVQNQKLGKTCGPDDLYVESQSDAANQLKFKLIRIRIRYLKNIINYNQNQTSANS